MCDEDTYVVVKNYNDPSRLVEVKACEGYWELFGHVYNVLVDNVDVWECLHPVLDPLVECGLSEDLADHKPMIGTLQSVLVKSCLPSTGKKGGIFEAVFEGAHRDEPLPEFASFEDPDRRELLKKMCCKHEDNPAPMVATLLLNWINLRKHGHHVHTTVTWKIEM